VVLALTTFAIGVVIGFIGAGGAGVLVAVLSSVFHLQSHEAIGTAIATMCFLTLSGTISHFREGNIAPKLGFTVGFAGVVGAIIGASIGQQLSDNTLRLCSGLALWFLAALVWVRTQFVRVPVGSETIDQPESYPSPLPQSVGLGLSGGLASSLFGVGMAPFLQLGYLTIFKLPLRITVGTTMLTLIFISASGATVLATSGDVSVHHLIGAVIGMSGGSYFGAKYTRRAPKWLLRFALVAVPFIAGSLILFL
jgi:uncharacterized membrane protein YfcA